MSDRLIGAVCGVGAAAIWGGSSVVSRYLITSSFDAADLTFLRYAACFPAALAIYLIWYPRLVNQLSWRAFAVLVLLAGPPFHFLVIAGYAYLPAGLGTVLIAGLLAVFTTFSAPFLGGGPVRSTQVFATGLVLAGLAGLSFQIVGGSGWQADASGWPMVAGVLIFATAALLWALLNHLIVAWKIDPLAMTINLALTAPLFLPFYWLLSTGPATGRATGADIGDVALQLIYHGLFVALGATFLFFAAVRRIGAGPAAVLLALAPALAVVFGRLFLGETLTALSFAGVAMVLAGFLGTLLSKNSGDPVR